MVLNVINLLYLMSSHHLHSEDVRNKYTLVQLSALLKIIQQICISFLNEIVYKSNVPLKGLLHGATSWANLLEVNLIGC